MKRRWGGCVCRRAQVSASEGPFRQTHFFLSAASWGRWRIAIIAGRRLHDLIACSTPADPVRSAVMVACGALMRRQMNALGQPIGEAIPAWQSAARPPHTSIEGRYCTVEAIDPERHAKSLFAAISDD